MKILILGAKGMLGNDLAKEFKKENLVLWDREELDITNEENVFPAINNLKPEIVINAAAFTDVDSAEDKKDLAFLVNSTAVGFLADVTKKINAKIFHISTEYVFDGNKKSGYNEDSIPNPLNVYGESKLAGENKIIQSGVDYYIIRTSWLYGHAPQRGKPRGKNFIDTILDKAKAGDDLTIVDDQFGRPTYTKDLAKQIRYIMENNLKSGIYHAVNEGVVSWYNFAKKALQIKKMNVNINSCMSGEFPTKAIRPKYSILNNSKLPLMRNWEIALQEYLN